MAANGRPALYTVDLTVPPSSILTHLGAALDRRAHLTVVEAPHDAACGDIAPEDLSSFSELMIRLANHALEVRGLTLSCVQGPIDGFNLEVALRCDVLAIAPDAPVRLSRQSRHASGIRRAFSERLGLEASGRLFDRSTMLDGSALLDSGLALYAVPDGQFASTIERVARRASAMIPLFAASRLTFPVEPVDPDSDVVVQRSRNQSA